ncbi:MAG: hypothetical protein J7K04_10160, partial [Spirochaetales bacterium]|nr:hypothetical protein [Spirochaetales bacterium]
SMLAAKLRGFNNCDASKVYRNFVRGKGSVAVNGNQITVTYPKRAHNPILRAVPWGHLPNTLPWFKDAKLKFRFN